jgi:hypothetical protein
LPWNLPNEIVFNMWRKGDVAEESAGHLVRMAEGQSVTWKLTKKLSDMRPIADLPTCILALKKRAKRNQRFSGRIKGRMKPPPLTAHPC